MFYLCLAISFLWAIHIAYLFVLDRQVRNLGKRLKARMETLQDQ